MSFRIDSILPADKDLLGIKRSAEDAEQSDTKRSKTGQTTEEIRKYLKPKPIIRKNRTYSFSNSAPSTFLAPTPVKKGKFFPEAQNFFNGNILPTETDSQPLQGLSFFSTNNVYREGDKVHTIFKQPPRSKSCFGHCFGMLVSDYLRETPDSLKLDDGFKNAIKQSYLDYADKYIQLAKHIGLPAEATKIPKETCLNFVRDKIESSGFPVIASITHKKINGHAIMVDQVTDSHTTVRDPYSGLAWRLTNEEAKKLFHRNEDCILITRHRD